MIPAIPRHHFSGGAHLTGQGDDDLAGLLSRADAKASVRGASTANIADLTACSTTFDGLTLVEGDRILLKNQSTGSQNGVYDVGAVASGVAPLTRSKDADVSAEVTPGLVVYVEAGTANGGTKWHCTNTGTVTLGTTSLTFAQDGVDAATLAGVTSTTGANLVGYDDSPAVTSAATAADALDALMTGGNAATALAGLHRVRGASTANIADLTAFTVAGVDGLTYAAGERILLKDQSTGAENGIYVVGTVGGGTAPLTRAGDWAAASVIPSGSLIAVAAGTVAAGRVYKLTNATAMTVATTTPTFDRLVNSTELASTAAALGAALVGINDTGNIITATTVEAALQEIKALVDAGLTLSKKTVTVAHGDLTDGDTSQTINIGTALPANARVIGVEMHTLTEFSGGGTTSLTVDVGTAGDIDALVDGADLFTAAVDGGPATMPAGVRPNKSLGAAQIVATFVCDGGHILSDFSAGTVTIDVLYTVLA